MRMTAALFLLMLAPLFAVAATPVVNNGTINYSTNQIMLTGSGFEPNKTKPTVVQRQRADGFDLQQYTGNGPRDVPNRQNELVHGSDRMALDRRTNWLLRPSITGGDFQEGLASVKRKYPTSQFQAFWSTTKRYAELTKADALIHKQVAVAVRGLVD